MDGLFVYWTSDTIEVMDSRAVRIGLINIDAPEKKQDYGRWSTDMMKSLVAGKTVTVTYFQRDRYGRIFSGRFMHQTE